MSRSYLFCEVTDSTWARVNWQVQYYYEGRVNLLMFEANNVSEQDRICRQQLLSEAEGYLDLVTVFADKWPPSTPVRDRLCQRALDVLATLEPVGEGQSRVFYLKGQALLTMERWAEAIERMPNGDLVVNVQDLLAVILGSTELAASQLSKDSPVLEELEHVEHALRPAA